MYRIQSAAEQAGVSPELVRAWERRYGLLDPERTDSGYRLYSDDDVAVLRGAKALVDQGRSISEVARIPRDQLRRMGTAAPAPSMQAGPVEPFLAAAMGAITALDAARLESLLARATSLGGMSSVEICARLLMPLLEEIGARWEEGSLDIAAEHFGSALVRRHLHLLVQDESRRNAGAPAIVCACPSGELHEGGLLGFALNAAALGWAIVYLGANTPVDQIIAAADRSGASVLALSMIQPRGRQERRDLIEDVATWKNRMPGRLAWAGGRDAQTHARELAAAGIEVLDRLTGLPRGRPLARP